MLLTQKNDHSQLWFEEQQILASFAEHVPDDGIIVEIGTSYGGSAKILYDAAGKRGARIFTYDVAPPQETYEYLKKTSVNIIKSSSVTGAKKWTNNGRELIDLLFIDGSHTFLQKFDDFNHWAPLLKNGGTILFHDYDSEFRGGLRHLGVKILLDTIVRLTLVSEPVHLFKLLSGKIDNADPVRVNSDDCLRTFLDLGARISKLIEQDYSDWALVGDEKFTKVLRICCNVDKSSKIFSVHEIGNENVHYLLFDRSTDIPLSVLKNKNAQFIDSLTACYIVEYGLRKNRDALYELSSEPGKFLRWEEMIFMFEHAHGPSAFPFDLQSISETANAEELSKLIAREQIRLNFLSEILTTLVDWQP